VESAREVLVALAGRYAFGEVAALVAAGAGGPGLTIQGGARIDQLCAFGQRLLDLDAEDFGNPDAASGANTEHVFADQFRDDTVPEPLLHRALACRMPQHPHERHRGALGSLRPTFALILEVIAARWRRRETAALVAAVHITSEYLPLLIWEQVLGYAGDPARLPADVTGEPAGPVPAPGSADPTRPGSSWGDFDDRDCEHNKPDRSAARRATVVAGEPAAGWRGYLDRQHSNTSHALAVCAGQCRHPCTVLTRHSAEQRKILAAGCTTALAYIDSPIVRLRHAAPVGHGFGVPSPAEVLEAWERTRASLTRHVPAVLSPDGFPLPGLPSLFSALAGAQVRPDTLVADTATALVGALG
jgi:hypothetical protein